MENFPDQDDNIRNERSDWWEPYFVGMFTCIFVELIYIAIKLYLKGNL